MESQEATCRRVKYTQGIFLVLLLTVIAGASVYRLNMGIVEQTINRDVNAKATTTTAKACKPVENVIFLKTHKTGSSTVANIFQRYAVAYKKKVVVPPNGTHLFKYPRRFSEEIIYMYRKGEKYNFLFNHATFNKEPMLNLMASNDTKIVTIIREPYNQYASVARYFHFDRKFELKKENPILDEFFGQPLDSLLKYRAKGGLLVNLNSKDLGHDVSKETIQEVLDGVSKDFDFIMIADYMIESLVLLAKELCWDIEDVVFFTLNAQKDREHLNSSNKTRIEKFVKAWNDYDTAMFEMVNKTFWKKVFDYGSHFKEDVDKLRRLNKKVSQMCQTFKTETDSEEYNIFLSYLKKSRNNLCTDMTTNTRHFDKRFKKYRLSYLNKKPLSTV